MANLDDNKITFLGDVYLPSVYDVNINLGNYVFNLEYPITKNDLGVPGKVNLKVDSNHILDTFGHNPVSVCLANNHIIDYGDSGFLDTIAELEASGISYFGGGSNKDNCNNSGFITIGEHKVALLGYVCASTSPVTCDENEYGVRLIDLAVIKKDIENAKLNGCEKIVVSLHWGAEQISKPKPDDVDIAHQIIDEGADLIIGHHAHCIQDYEIYNDKYIFYGIGNCIFPDLTVDAMYNPETQIPERQFTVKQKYWNKTSLAITYDLSTDQVTIDVLSFNGVCLNQKPWWYPGGKSRFIFSEAYRDGFDKYYLYGKIKNALFNWLYSPKFPSIRHVKSLLSLLNSKVYK